MKLVRVLALACVLSSLSSCAAMFTGTKGEVLFTATPAEGTSVLVGDQTYSIDNLPRKIKKSTKKVVFSNPQYGEYIVPVKRSFQGGFLLMDILFTPGYGISGILVDAGTSAWYKLPSTIQFDFIAEVARQSNDKDPNGTKIAKASTEEVDALTQPKAEVKPASAPTGANP